MEAERIPTQKAAVQSAERTNEVDGLQEMVVASGGIAASDWLHILPLVLLVRGLGLDMIGIARLSSALREVHAARA
jgi:hypothetical protein